MDGLEATRRIRLKGGTLPIIALTANAYDSDRDKAFEAGLVDGLYGQADHGSRFA